MWGKNESCVWRISIDILLLSIHLTKSRLWANGVFRITGFCFKCPTLFPYCTEVKVIISNKTTTNSNRWYDRSTINNWQSNQSAHCICGQQNSTRYFFPEGKHIASDNRKLKSRYLWYQCILKSFKSPILCPTIPVFSCPSLLIFDKRKEKQRVGRCFLNSCFLDRLSFSAFPWTLLTQEHQCLAVQYLKNGFVAVFFTLWHSPWALVHRCSHCCFLSLFLSDMNFFVRRRFSLACRILKDKQNASLSSMRQGHQLGSLTGPSFRPKFSLHPVIPRANFQSRISPPFCLKILKPAFK